jgi:cysteinyl-tRNA synthetase
MKVYNSLTYQKEEFKSISPNEVLMYVCGPTVYDSPHLGHAKSAVAFDIISRYFKFKGFNVKNVKNYTDIDDKIIKRANERNIDFEVLSNQYIDDYEEIMKILNVQKDYKNPRATEVISYMIEMIKGLIDKENAYESNGSVYYDVSSFPKYKAVLQKINEDEIEEEIEEEPEDSKILASGKRNVKDFALWKNSKEGEPFWESPWGKGRPGWHIECSAMAMNFLGDTIDIHGGGRDLKFPHHRNEIAQSEAFTGKTFANYFMHNGFVNIDNEKMSKSLDNFFLVSDVAREYNPMVIRFFLLSSHYRKSINYSLENMNQAKKNYEKIVNTIERIYELDTEEIDPNNLKELISTIDNAELKILNAMDDDFNTPVAIAEILTFFKNLNRIIFENKGALNKEIKNKFFNFIEKIDEIFGIFPNLIKNYEAGSMGTEDEKDKLIKDLLNLLKETRSKLRAKKDYNISDYIREKIKELGLNIEDK